MHTGESVSEKETRLGTTLVSIRGTTTLFCNKKEYKTMKNNLTKQN